MIFRLGPAAEQALTPIPGNLAERTLTRPRRSGQGNALASTNLLNQHLPGPWGRIRAAPGAAVPISPPTAPGGSGESYINSNYAKRLGAYSPTKPARFRWMAIVSRSPAGRTRAQQAAVAASRASACTCRPLAA